MFKRLCLVATVVACVGSCGVVAGSASLSGAVDKNFAHWCKSERDGFTTAFGGCYHAPTGLVWGMRLPGMMTVQDAGAACRAYDDGGYRDWTLPSRADLVRIGENRDAVDHFDFPSHGAFFWVKPTNSLTLPQAVDLSTGERQTLEWSDKSAVVCVRSIAVKRCDSAVAIQEHIGYTLRPRLVTNGQAVADINDRFCVHTVADGSKRLADGKKSVKCPQCVTPVPTPPVTNGLLVAIADVGHGADNADGASFLDAQTACSELTLLAKKWAAPASRLPDVKPRESDEGRSLDAIGGYLYDPVLDTAFFGYGQWWSSSISYVFRDDAWVVDAVIGYGNKAYAGQLAGVRCIAQADPR